MKAKLQLFPTKGMTQEDWLRFRKRGVGASDVGTILGLNPYKCSAQLFWEKVSDDIGLTVENMAMFLGKEQEDFIANLWQYWEDDEQQMMTNYRAGRIVRRCQRVNAYVINPDFPWLFVSLDRKINKGAKTIVSAIPQAHGGAIARGMNVTETGGTEGALELKTIAGYEADKWEAGIPPSHVVQVQTQLLVCEFLFGELAVLKDGRTLDVIPFEFSPGITETIITRTKEFWDRVEKGRILATRRFEAERNYNYKAVEQLEAELSSIEPPPDGSDAFAKYLKERYRIAEPGEQSGTDEHFTWALNDQDAAEKIKRLEQARTLAQNQLKNVLRAGADKLTFGPRGYISWKTDAKGSRRFLNKIKP